MLNTNVNVEIQELNVKEVLLANPSVVMLLMLNTANTVGPWFDRAPPSTSQDSNNVYGH